MSSQPLQNWISDTELSSRFPYYTRANADEVGPDPFSPLGWSLGWAKGCIPGVAGGFISFGVVSADEFAVDPPEVFGNWGGYFYNQLSLPRVMGCRMPGASPEAIDQAYFGDHPGVPDYTPHPDDDNPEQTAKLEATMGWAMSTDGFPRQDETAAMARRVVAERPDFTAMADADLVAYGRRMASLVEEAWVPYCETCLAVSLGPGAVQAICDAAGRSEDAVKLLAAIGDVESAEASFIMWDLSRTVAGSPALMEAFDDGVDGLLGRLGDSDDDAVAMFGSGFADLLEQHGHRGPNEWDMRPHSWTTKPELALGMIERLRYQDDARSPHVAKAAAAEERERLSAEILAMVESDEEAHGTLTAGLASAALFYSLREKGKNSCIRLIHEAKLAFFELGRRMVQIGAIDDVQQVFMAVDSELEALLADPQSMRDALLQRDSDFATLHTLEPPYIVKYEEGVPPISEWAPRNSGTAETVAAGDVLQGGAGAPGVTTGTARVVLDPSDPSAIQPGDIMVAPTTDPSWTPLFLSAAGVVVNVGAVASHAAIVCRELGVPCAVSVVDATRRIPDGATIEIDGATGAVTIIDLP
ncbi:MAG: PEP-utilizing enzyme [Acidimicrobiales bacterium]|jgi:pyruvate,water dikinase|nr:PEP-utilizing enzyme [Acidimicrobiales bacterium]